MSDEFVRLMVRGEKPFRSLDMIAPLEQAEQALWALALEMPSGLVWEARPVDSLDLRAEVPR